MPVRVGKPLRDASWNMDYRKQTTAEPISGRNLARQPLPDTDYHFSNLIAIKN
jgi:hypothetical protein